MELTDEMKRAAVYAYEHATEYPYNQSALYVAVAAALNTRSSLLGMVPEGWEFADPFPLEQVDGAWRANIRKRNGQFWTAAYGTGLTPESAVTDAASKVKP